MIALTGAWRRLHLPQQHIHLVWLHATARAHRMMARDRRQPMIEATLQTERTGSVASVIRKIPDKTCQVAGADEGRRFPHKHGSRAKAFQEQPKTGEVTGGIDKSRRSLRIEFYDNRLQKRLTLNAMRFPLALQTLIDDPLVSGMLINENHAVPRLRDDIRIVKLRAGCAQRKIDLS